MESKIEIKSIAKFDHCFGCGVCAAICPERAITIEINSFGFFSPKVNDDCINCSLCLQICSFNNKDHFKSFTPLYGYSGWSTNADVRDSSTSGGVMTELSKMAIDKGFNVCAVKYNYAIKRAEHFLFNTFDKLDLAKGSKYLQSNSLEALFQFDYQRKHVVIGTPCFISSLRLLLKRKQVEDQFILIDFFCHGIPSYLLWNKYLSYVEQQIGAVTMVKWRNKDNGWQDSDAVKACGNKGRYLSFLSNGDLFFTFFLKNRCLNRCCYDDCVFKQANSCADIRLGDFWGQKYLTNRLGVNSIITFSNRGDAFLHSCKSCNIEVETLNTVTAGQLHNNPRRPKSYSYVSRALQDNTLGLREIDKKASRIERAYRLISISYYKKLVRRAVRELILR